MFVFFGYGSIAVLVAALMLLGSVAFAIWYAIMQAKEESQRIEPVELTTGQRIGVLIDLLLIFGSVALLAYGFLAGNGYAAVAGLLLWMITALIAAYTCSPLRLPGYGEEASGCGYLLIYPLLTLVNLIAVVLIMLISWVFALIALLKGLSKKVYFLIGGCILALVAVGFGIAMLQQEKEDDTVAREAALTAQIIRRVELSIAEGKQEPIVYMDEEKTLMEQWEHKPFYTLDATLLIAEKLSALYREQDFDGIVQFLKYLDYHRSVNFIGEETAADLVLHPDFMHFLEQEIQKRATSQEGSFYYVGADEFFLDGNILVFEDAQDYQVFSGSLATETYRNKYYRDYQEDPGGLCLIVGQSVEYKEYESNKKPTSYGPVTCPQCGTTFRSGTTRAGMIEEYGYCGYGLCGRD